MSSVTIGLDEKTPKVLWPVRSNVHARVSDAIEVESMAPPVTSRVLA